MTASWPWLDVASLALGVLALALGAWYGVDKWLEGERRRQADKWGGDVLTGLSLFPTSEAEEPTGAEEILAASPGPVVDRLFGASANLVARTRQASAGHRWAQLVATACVLLLLACLAVLLFVPLLLIMAFGYVSDSGHDIRLRLVVGLFLVDIALQVIANVR